MNATVTRIAIIVTMSRNSRLQASKLEQDLDLSQIVLSSYLLATLNPENGS